MPSLLLAIGALFVLWTVYNATCLLSNYVKASKLGLPCVLIPISPDNQLWIAIQTAFGGVLRRLPFSATSFTRHCRLGWEFHDRYETHLRLGDAWILVTPNRNWFHVSEASAVHDIQSRGRDFGRPVWMLAALDAFGPNIATAEGQDWQRQRKLTATPFNESKSALVWDESMRQANDMLNSWLAKGFDGLNGTTEDVRTLALHVLAYVAFQRSYPFKSVSRRNFENAKSMTYRDSLAIILENVVIVLVVPLMVYTLPFVPKSWKQVGWAIQNFRQYMLDQLKDEKRLIQDGKPGSNTLVSNLVRASNEAAAGNQGSLVNKPLSEAEILGNIFVFNFAGHDTTAITLGYGMLLLAASPEVQDWAHEELSYYLPNREPLALSYSELFPKLKRCLAVLLETVRLYDPLLGTPKYTGSTPSSLTVNGTEYIIPADYLVVPNLQAVHTHPRYWDSDSLEWRPQRWIVCSSSKDSPADISSETLFVPQKGMYFPWSEGIRSCPGKKFAQVEFVATMATLFAKYVVEPVPIPGESQESARKRTLGIVKNSNVELLLQMTAPKTAFVRWRERDARI